MSDLVKPFGEAAESVQFDEREFGGYPVSCLRKGWFPLEGEQVIAIVTDLLTALEAAERGISDSDAALGALKADIAKRNKVDPVWRLHNLADAMAEEAKDSPYSQESWDLQDEAYRQQGVELAASRKYAEQIIRLVGDETVKAARLHTEARRLMASNEHEHGAVYCALCALRDRIAALANHQPKEKT